MIFLKTRHLQNKAQPCPAQPNPMPRYAPLCPAMPRYAPLCPAMPRYAMLCPAMPHYALLCPAIPCYAPLCHSIPCHFANMKYSASVHIFEYLYC
jgi:hypothetical protein